MPRAHEDIPAAEPATVAAVLRAGARARPDRPLLICDAERLNYADAERRSAQLARGLIALGAGKGTHVGLLYPNGADFVIGALAAARIGAVVVPYSTFATAPELSAQLAHSDTRILLAEASFRSHNYLPRLADVLADADIDPLGRVYCRTVPQLRHVAVRDAHAPGVHNLSDILALADTIDDTLLAAVELDVDGCDPLAIVYTSGSTGAPKGVAHSHAGLLTHQRNLNRIRGLTERDILFCNSPFFWIGGFAFGLLATLVAGATLVCSNATDPGATLDLLESTKPTITNGFAAGIAHLARHPSFAARDLSSMRRGNLYPIMPAAVRPADPELRHNMLGMTEAGSVVLISDDESDQPEHHRGSFGTPAPGFDIRIIDPDTGSPVAVGDIGEFCYRGPYVMLGYHKRSREECFDPDGWFHTGDLVRADTDGFVYFIGRSGSMIKSAGANISPAEVEKAIAKITGGAAYVFGLPHADRGEVAVAVITVADPAAFDEAELRTALRAELSAYKIPARIAAVTVAEIPLMSSGKVDLRQLKTMFEI